jgi:KaiC/GvpD/RAD55 family RecA-like ATPase
MDINKNFTRIDNFIDYDDYENGLVKLYDYNYRTLGKSWRLKNFRNIHEFITSFHQGEFHVIAGRPKMGKTYLALSMVMDLYKQGARVGIASAEMAEDKMIQRCDMLATGLPPIYFEGGYTTQSFIDKIKKTREEYKKNGGKLFFIGFENNNDLYTGTVWDLAKEIDEHKLDVLLIDSLYAYRSSIRRNSTWESTVDIINDAVSLTRQYNTLTLVTTQFSRQANKRKGNAKAEDVGYSDAFLQYCDSLIGLTADKDMQKTGTRRLDVLAVREGHEGEFFINYKFEPKLQIKDVDNGYYVKGEDEDIDIGTFEDDGLNEFENW